jgi:hypothetical protein
MIDLPTTLHAPASVRMPRFEVPASVTEIDLVEDPAIAEERLAARARTALPGISDGRVAYLVAAQRAIVDTLRAGGACWAGSCVARRDAHPSRLTVAHLAASLVEVEVDTVDPATVVAAVVAYLSHATGNRVAEVIQLPAGPAIVVIDEQVVRTAMTVVGSPDGTEHRVRQILVALPVPDAPWLAVLTLATEHLADWADYLGLMADLARSVVFTRD